MVFEAGFKRKPAHDECYSEQADCGGGALPRIRGIYVDSVESHEVKNEVMVGIRKKFGVVTCFAYCESNVSIHSNLLKVIRSERVLTPLPFHSYISEIR